MSGEVRARIAAGQGLPVAIAKIFDTSCVAARHPENPNFELWQEHDRCIRSHLAALPPALWKLLPDAEWQTALPELLQCVDVRPVPRAKSKEDRAHKAIAETLRRAAQQVRRHPDDDVTLEFAMWAAAEVEPSLKGWTLRARRALVGGKVEVREPDHSARLSAFLLALERVYRGDEMRFGYFHRGPRQPTQCGANGAARLASEWLDAFMRKRTRKPHAELVHAIVAEFHPGADDRDRARGLRNKSGKTSRS